MNQQPTVKVMSNDRASMDRIMEIYTLPTKARAAALAEWQQEQRKEA